MDHTKLAETLLEALQNEKTVDIEETAGLLASLSPKRLEAKGLAVLNLIVGSMRTGLGGKTILELQPDPAIFSKSSPAIESGSIRVGDNVKIEPYGSKSVSKATDSNYIEAVVVKTTNQLIAVAMEEKHEGRVDELDGRVWIAQLSNPGTYRRIEYALKDLGRSQSLSPLHDILLGNRPPQKILDEKIKVLDETLNEPQREAVQFALSSELSVIHGPPGTGKTYTLIEIIRQLIARGERVLVCGPSNISVDNILERLHPLVKGDKLVRVGHPARLLPSTLIHSLDIVSKTSNQGQIIKDIRDDIDSALSKVKKTRSGRERKAVYTEVKDLRKEYRRRERKVLSSIILESQVVVSTLHGAGSKSIREAISTLGPSRSLFDTVIIDEVSQSLEAQCWIPLMMVPAAKRLVIAGDNFQLPPTVKTKSPKYKAILETTIFDRLIKIHEEDKIKRLLSIQYRMNEKIMEFPSKALYGGKLKADASVATRLLKDLPHAQDSDETSSVVTWLDTQGGDFFEAVPEDGRGMNLSRLNENEAYLTRNYVMKLLGEGLKEEDIGVISPYNAQVSLVRKLLESHPGIEISTVDGFQGREKEAIVMTLVRSNDKREVGFLSEERRTNVAITRPRRHLCIIGDTETVGAGSKILKSWVNWAEENADVEYPDVSEL